MQLLVVITSINHVTVELKGFVLHIPTVVGQINPDNTMLMMLHPAITAFFCITLWLIFLNVTYTL